MLAVATLLAACGGDGGSAGGQASSAGGSGTSSSSSGGGGSTVAGCSLRERQDFAFATLKEWYLFPETLPAGLDPSPYASVGDYVDALTATARSQRRDRFFTYVTSIAEENAFFNAGASAGFGVRLAIDSSNRLWITEAFEGAPALATGIDRGTEVTAIGNDAGSMRTVSAIIATEGTAGVTAALGPNTAGTTRTLQLSGHGGARTVTVAKANYTLSPVSSRYGALILNDGGRRIGYLNLRTFISTADDQLRTAFANFRAQGITLFIIDLRYNGGGLISTSELLGDLLGGNRSSSDIFDMTTFRPDKSSNNSIRRFAPQSQSVSPVKIAFIGTGSTASASELVINAFVPFLGANEALVGANTYGKPVGQIAVDKASCDDRVRVIAFATRNGASQGDYFDGLASKVPVTCRAGDDYSHALGDTAETSIRQALNFLGGVSCTPIASENVTGQSVVPGPPRFLSPAAPNASQREVPGLF